MKRRRKPAPWSRTMIAAAKALVKSEIDSGVDDEPAGGRLQRINKGIRSAEGAESPEEYLRLFIYVVSALVHAARSGGLSVQDVARLRKLAYSILQVQGIQPESSTLAFLYGELHLALSQIYRQRGEHWAAAWEQQMCLTLARRDPPGGTGFQLVSQAIRALRLGSASRAFAEFTEAEGDPDLDLLNRERARLGRIRCLRLGGDLDGAARLAEQSCSLPNLRLATVVEMKWEMICAMASSDLATMIASVGSHGDHHQPVYLVEAILWSHAVKSREWSERLPKASTVARRRGGDAQKLGFFLEAAKTVEACYDVEVPLVIRLDRLGTMLARRQELISVDRELLVLAAAARWLWRAKQRSLAATVLEDYRGLSLRLSNGASIDVLSLTGDILQDDGEVAA